MGVKREKRDENQPFQLKKKRPPGDREKLCADNGSALRMWAGCFLFIRTAETSVLAGRKSGCYEEQVRKMGRRDEPHFFTHLCDGEICAGKQLLGFCAANQIDRKSVV